jgi:surface protein
MSRRVTYYNVSYASVNNSFVSTWDTTKAGSASNTVILPLLVAGVYSGTIDWGDGNTSILSYANRTHVYATTGVKTITITGVIGGWQFNNSGDRRKIIDVSNWGTLDITTKSAFYGCSNLVISALDAPTLSTISLNQTFRSCTSLTTPDFNSWDFSSVTDMSNMFQSANSFNGDISGWDVSNVTDMAYMFRSADSFNQDISGWNVSSVTNMSLMFNNATSFNQDISSWDINQVTNFSNFMLGYTLSTANYDALLIAWDAQGAMSYSGTVNFGGSQYTLGGAAEAARTSLISKWGGITDGGGI